MERKTRFRIALAIRSDREDERYTARDFARDHDCSKTMLYDVLNGNRTSQRLETAVEDFIADQADRASLDLQAHEPAAA